MSARILLEADEFRTRQSGDAGFPWGVKRIPEAVGRLLWYFPETGEFGESLPTGEVSFQPINHFSRLGTAHGVYRIILDESEV